MNAWARENVQIGAGRNTDFHHLIPEMVKLQAMNRREMIKTVTLGTALPLPVLQHKHPPPAAKKPPALKFLTAEQNEFVVQLTELIIPQTEAPGARAAGVNLYIDQVLAAAEEAEKKSFLDGLDWLDSRARQLHGAPFMKLSEAQQVAILEPLATQKNTEPDDQFGVRFLERVKQLTVTGFYTSADGYVSELGFTTGFTGDFPGCTHPAHK